jgi:hypothetical protein
MEEMKLGWVEVVGVSLREGWRSFGFLIFPSQEVNK